MGREDELEGDDPWGRRGAGDEERLLCREGEDDFTGWGRTSPANGQLFFSVERVWIVVSDCQSRRVVVVPNAQCLVQHFSFRPRWVAATGNVAFANHAAVVQHAI
jgi:hypothetical protein